MMVKGSWQTGSWNEFVSPIVKPERNSILYFVKNTSLIKSRKIIDILLLPTVRSSPETLPFFPEMTLFLDFDIYNIHVKTSDKLYSGTDNDIYITLSGEKDGRKKNTGEFLLDKSGRNDFERNQVDDFRVPATALGT